MGCLRLRAFDFWGWVLYNEGDSLQCKSLWKDPACRPYVDQESRSTRHLDESPGWDEAAFEAFARLLAGKTSVTPPIVDVYREHHPPYKRRIGRIAATDPLID